MWLIYYGDDSVFQFNFVLRVEVKTRLKVLTYSGWVQAIFACVLCIAFSLLWFILNILGGIWLTMNISHTEDLRL